jgi:hypothetical protein
MVDTRPLLKGFGAAADVIGQIATDKAVNSRRLTPISAAIEQAKNSVVEGAVAGSAILDGQLIEDATIVDDTTGVLNKIPHNLNRVPSGAILVKMSATASGETHCRSTTVNDVTIASSVPGTATLWVF